MKRSTQYRFSQALLYMMSRVWTIITLRKNLTALDRQLGRRSARA